MTFRWKFRILFGAAVLGLLSTLPAIAMNDEAHVVAGPDRPVANPAAVVVEGHARFTVLTPRLIRMEWSADGKFEDHASLVFLNRDLPVPVFTHSVATQHGAKVLTVTTHEMKLTYRVDGGKGGRFNAENLGVALQVEGKEVVWHPGMAGAGNLMGTTRTLDGARGSKTKEPIGEGLISRDGWVVVDDSTRPLFDSSDFRFKDGEKSPWPWVMERGAGERQDFYFFGYGHDYKQALGDYVKVAGRIPLPPRFAFGSWWSRYWSYSDQELTDLVKGFHENDVPLDVLVIDMGWHPTFHQSWWDRKMDQSGHVLGWGGYTWDKDLFPDPKGFLDTVHEDGLKVTLNLHPAAGVQPWEERYPEMARAMNIDPGTKKYVPFEITDKKFATNYMDIMHHPLEKEGVDFWWLDWQQEPTTKIAGLNPTWWLNYVHFTDQAREGKRPLLFHRWGGLGNHRYQIGFSGDTVSTWDSLAFQPGFTANAANVGYAYWSHDIGGHIPGAVSPELYTRWVQFGAFSPILRTHTTSNSEAERRIWAYPEPYSDILRDSFKLRYAMVPYIYTEARKTYDTGVAFDRPLYYDWPEAEEAYSMKNEYQFGDQMIVAPVTDPVDTATQLASEPIWLPKGEWIEWPTGKHFAGPVKMARKFSMSQIPVYVAAGAIVPMAPPMRSTNEKPLDPLIVTVFPAKGADASEYTLYEDAGDTRSYEQDQAARTTITAKEAEGDLMIRIEPTKGSYPGMPAARSYEIRLPADWPPDAVTANGKALGFVRKAGEPGWRFEGNTLTTVIETSRLPVTEAMTLHVHRPMKLVGRRAELDGFAGKMARTREAYGTINQTMPLAWSPDELTRVVQTGDRLSYHPESASEEFSRFAAAMMEARNKVQAMSVAMTPEAQAEIAKKMGTSWQAGHMKEQMTAYQANFLRALTALADGMGEDAPSR